MGWLEDVPRKRQKGGIIIFFCIPPSGAPIWAIKNNQFSYNYVLVVLITLFFIEKNDFSTVAATT